MVEPAEPIDCMWHGRRVVIFLTDRSSLRRQKIRTCQAPSYSFRSFPGGAFMKLTEGAASAYSSAKIRALRARYKLSQAVLATVLNTSLSTVRQ